MCADTFLCIACQEFLQLAAKAQPAFLHAMRRCIAAYLAAQPVLQKGIEAPAGDTGSMVPWGRNLPATAALLRGLILLADTKFDGVLLLPTELLTALPKRCVASVAAPYPILPYASPPCFFCCSGGAPGAPLTALCEGGQHQQDKNTENRSGLGHV